MEFLQSYKNRQCQTLLGKYFQGLIFNWLYKICTAIVLISIGGVSMNFVPENSFLGNCAYWIYLTGIAGMLVIGIMFIIYAIIINPIKSLIKKTVYSHAKDSSEGGDNQYWGLFIEKGLVVDKVLTSRAQDYEFHGKRGKIST